MHTKNAFDIQSLKNDKYVYVIPSQMCHFAHVSPMYFQKATKNFLPAV